jgi:tetratricopeptide (TPR) repeat protein
MSVWRLRLVAPALAGVFVCALLTGCATPQVADLAARWPERLPATAQVAGVPFFPQEDYECGPAALAMAAGAAGVSVTPAALAPQVFLPGRQGSLQVEMLAATRRQGLLAYPLAPRIEALLTEVAAGTPVVVFQNLSFAFSPVWHYAVVIGYDRARNMLTLHSGVSERLEMSMFTFERTWERGGHWAMLALQPGRLPVTADPLVHATAAAALERVNPRAAQAAYAASLQRWPGQRAAMLGLGNTAYAQNDLARAAGAYEATTAAHPDFADAWNNLAQVRLEMKALPQALAAAERAVALGGPREARYRALREEIKSKVP